MTKWDATGTRVGFAILTAAGVILLFLQVWRRRPVVLALDERPQLAPATVNRRHLERALTGDTSHLDGVASSRVKAKRRRVEVDARTNRMNPGDMEQRLYSTVEGRITSLGLVDNLPVTVALEHRKDPRSRHRRESPMSLGSTRRADRVNRVVLSVLGALMLLGGAAGLAFSLGAFGDDRSKWPLFSGELRDWMERNYDWVSIAVIAACLILAALSLRWLLFQAKPQPSVGDFSFPFQEGEGKTSLSARAVVDAVIADLSDQPGVRKAGARLRHQDPLVVDAWVDYDSASYVPAFRQSVQEQILPRLQHCLEIDEAVVNLELRLVSGTVARVD